MLTCRVCFGILYLDVFVWRYNCYQFLTLLEVPLTLELQLASALVVYLSRHK